MEQSMGIFNISQLFAESSPQVSHKKTFNSLTSALPNKLNNIKYLLCDKENHETQPLSMVCVDAKCKARTLICSICQSSDHRNHVIVPFKFYLASVFGHIYQSKQPQPLSSSVKNQPQNKVKQKNKGNKNNMSKETSQPESVTSILVNGKNILYYTKKLQQEKQDYLSQIKEIQDNINEKLHSLKATITKFYDNVTNEIYKIIGLADPLARIQKIIRQRNLLQESDRYRIASKSSVEKVKSYIEFVLSSTNPQNPFFISTAIATLLENSSSLVKEPLSSIEKSYSKFESQIKKAEELLAASITLPIDKIQVNMLSQLKFSQKLKGHKFVIRSQGKVIQQTGMQSSGQRFALLEPSLPSKTHFGIKQRRWSIKLIKLAGWVAIGICLKKHISTTCKFNFNYNTIGHGSYLISANGYTWSHSQKQFNSAYKSFTYTTNDNVHLVYNPEKKKLTFFKNKNDNKFQLDVVEPPEGDQYCACVNMCSSGDTVQLIEVEDDIEFK